MKHIPYLLYIILTAAILAACGQKTFDVPTTYVEEAQLANIYPDYKDIVVPENIAPLNFMVDGAEGMVASLEGNGITLTASGTDRIDMDSIEWRNLLKGNMGKEITVTVYTQKDGKWSKFLPHSIKVAEAIDPYLSYRLIETGYELYRQLGI